MAEKEREEGEHRDRLLARLAQQTHQACEAARTWWLAAGLAPALPAEAAREWTLVDCRRTAVAYALGRRTVIASRKVRVGQVSPGIESAPRNRRGKRAISLAMSCRPRSRIRPRVRSLAITSRAL